ncbi:MAG: SDR family oxidoreductase [Jiangellaceae bacterium]
MSIFDLSGKKALVTGAAGGVGRGCAELLAAAGAHVVCVDLVDGGRTVEIITERRGSAESVSLDVSDREAFEAVVDDVVARHGYLDVLVNNAGIQLRGTTLEATEEDIDRLIAVNQKSVLFGMQAAGRVMAARGSGSIINIASEAIDRPAADIVGYAGTKAAVRQMTRNAAFELGPKGVRVNTIAPGWMLTALTRASNGTEEQLQERLESRKAMSVVGRVGTPADVAYAALYLASDASSWMTGQALRLNGGSVMPW